MLTRVALTVLAAGAVTAGASTTTLVNGNAPERAPRPPKAEAASRAGGDATGDTDDTTGITATTPAAGVTPPPCPADVRNHGAYVSSVARGDEATGAEHGALVSAAARSDCGKPAADDSATAADRDARAAAKADKAAAKADRKAARESRRPDNPGKARTR